MMKYGKSLGFVLFLSIITLIGTPSLTVAQELPQSGTTKWEMEKLDVVVTFLLFDPDDPDIILPKGLRFISLSEINAPEFKEYLKNNPEHSDWVFSFVEFVRPKTWILDGKALDLTENKCIAVWFAPVDHSELADKVPIDRYETVIAPSPDALLVLDLWIPDREFAEYMLNRGHRAEYGMATLIEATDGSFQGELQLDNLTVKASARPQGEATSEPDPFTQVFFEPGEKVKRVVILKGRDARERDATAEWFKKGDHPLARGVFIGPTFFNVEGPLEGSAYIIEKD